MISTKFDVIYNMPEARGNISVPKDGVVSDTFYSWVSLGDVIKTFGVSVVGGMETLWRP